MLCSEVCEIERERERAEKYLNWDLQKLTSNLLSIKLMTWCLKRGSTKHAGKMNLPEILFTTIILKLYSIKNVFTKKTTKKYLIRVHNFLGSTYSVHHSGCHSHNLVISAKYDRPFLTAVSNTVIFLFVLKSWQV